MARLRVKNFGPIQAGHTKNDGWIEFKRVTVFIGCQGSGKSTIAKLFATFAWMEKVLVRGDYKPSFFEDKNKFREQLNYYRLDNYFSEGENNKTEIEYLGHKYHFVYCGNKLKIKEIKEIKKEQYILPQVVYIPAERNLVSYLQNLKQLRLSSESLQDFVEEFEVSKGIIQNGMPLPINGSSIEYNPSDGVINIKNKGKKLNIVEASSGFQSLVPVFLVTKFLTEKVQKKKLLPPMTIAERQRFDLFAELSLRDERLTKEQRRRLLASLSGKFNVGSLINIVEELEQNLFPSSQKEALFSLLQFNNEIKANKLLLTTHSPYIVNYLSIAIYADSLRSRIDASKNSKLSNRLNDIVPFGATVSVDDVAIYELNNEGEIRQLDMPTGVPSDNNDLNNYLRLGNELFDQLLELEEEL